jgi:hypothetical protein
VEPATERDITTLRRRENLGAPIGDRRLRAAVASGSVVRIAPGVFVRAAEWQALTPIERHARRVLEAVDRLGGPVVVSHAAAAAVWGIDRIAAWPDLIDVTVTRGGGGRSSGVFRRRTTVATDIETKPWRGHLLTTPRQTALDLARVSGFTDAVVALDQSLWARRPGGPLVVHGDLEELGRRAQPRSGDVRAARALEFASSLSDSVRESQSRVLLRVLGFPEPVLQQRFDLPRGRTAYTDFWFPEHDHAGEFDGLGKYRDPALLSGRTPDEALLEEKDRGDELRRRVRALSRWRTPDLTDPRRLYDILVADGLPTTRPRPPRGLLLG